MRKQKTNKRKKKDKGVNQRTNKKNEEERSKKERKIRIKKNI